MRGGGPGTAAARRDWPRCLPCKALRHCIVALVHSGDPCPRYFPPLQAHTIARPALIPAGSAVVDGGAG